MYIRFDCIVCVCKPVCYVTYIGKVLHFIITKSYCYIKNVSCYYTSYRVHSLHIRTLLEFYT